MYQQIVRSHRRTQDVEINLEDNYPNDASILQQDNKVSPNKLICASYGSGTTKCSTYKEEVHKLEEFNKSNVSSSEPNEENHSSIAMAIAISQLVTPKQKNNRKIVEEKRQNRSQ